MRWFYFNYRTLWKLSSRLVQEMSFTHSLGRGFELNRSQIPDAGDGVYTTQAFAKGALLSCFDGTRLTKPEAERKRDGFYQLDLGPKDDDMVIDAATVRRKCGSPIGGFINDPRNSKLVNVRFRREGDKVMIYAKRNLRQGEELFWDYGRMYWKTFEHATGKKPVKLVRVVA